MSIPDGFYDNRSNLRRENWRGNRVIEFIAASIITAPKPANAQVPWAVAPAWGTYPDLPNGTTMRIRIVAGPGRGVAGRGCPEWVAFNHGAIWTVFREPNEHKCYQRTSGAWLCVPVEYAEEIKDEGKES